MSESGRVAIVTGGNRGIGFEVCRQLGRAGLHVVLTARDADKAASAAATLQSEGLQVISHALDVTDPFSVQSLSTFLRDQLGRADVLVNNAGISLDGSRHVEGLVKLPLDVLTETFETNLYGPLRLAQAVAPLMIAQGYGRIVNVSSQLGSLAKMGSAYESYRISKTALNAVTRILHAELHDKKILVNSACPGWVRTDMGGPQAPRTPEQGADTIAWLATLPDDGPGGGFFQDREPIPW